MTSVASGRRHERWPEHADLRAARDVVATMLAPTPVIEAPAIGAGAKLKLETVQPTGSFKVRGALAALRRVTPGASVVTASSGNHALGVAWAAQRLGLSATIVVPTNASPAKLAALHALGAEVERVGGSFDEAEAHALALADADADAGSEYLSAYDDTHVIAGQATVGAELEALEGRITVVCPVGGGGLLSGLCLWARDKPGVRLVGVEAEASQAVSAAVRAGRVVDVEIGPTLADGMAGGIEPNAITWQIVRDRVDDLVTVTEDEIEAAIRHMVVEHGIVAEGAGAAATASVLAGRVATPGPRVALVTGRNIAAGALAAVLGRGGG